MMDQVTAANPLDNYRGKNRLIIASVPLKDDREKLAALLISHHQKLDDRNILVLNVSLGSVQISGTVRLDPKQTNILRQKFKVNPLERSPLFILIGKDSGEKARQQGVLNLDYILDLIDEMPMRREEIRNSNR